MQEDMHFYGTYAIARSAGIEPDDAFKIAYSAQYVDDSSKQDSELHDDRGLIYGIATAHKLGKSVLRGFIGRVFRRREDQRRVWVPFHFMPGGEGDTIRQKLVCTQNSIIAQEFFDNHIEIASKREFNGKEKSFGLHLLGIAAHVYTDTFSHYGFSGIASKYNVVNAKSIELIGVKNKEVATYLEYKAARFVRKYSPLLLRPFIRIAITVSSSEIAETLSNKLGHGGVSTFPDRPFLHWKVDFTDKHPSNNRFEDRDNPVTYLEACEKLHGYFVKFAKQYYQKPSIKKFADIRGTVEEILRFEGAKEKRIAKWQDAIRSGKLFEPSSLCKKVHYDPKDWESEKTNFHNLPKSSDAVSMDVYKFHQAATYHRYYVLKDLLPAHGIVVY